jgi:hypothetical protein
LFVALGSRTVLHRAFATLGRGLESHQRFRHCAKGLARVDSNDECEWCSHAAAALTTLTRLLEPRPWEAFEHQITIVRYTMVDERLPGSNQLKRPTRLLQLFGEYA